MTDRNHDLLELIDAKRRVEDLEKEVERLAKENLELKAHRFRAVTAYISEQVTDGKVGK